jgi:hypothetical protein
MATQVLPFVDITAPDYMCINPTDNNSMYCSSKNYGIVYKIDITSGTIYNFLTGINQPTGIAFDDNNNLYCVESGNNRIIKTTPEPDKITTIFTTYSGWYGDLLDLCFDSANQVFYSSTKFSGNGSNIVKFDMNGNISIYVPQPPVDNPKGIALDNENNAIYVANYNFISKTDLNNDITSSYVRDQYNTRSVVYKNSFVYFCTDDGTFKIIKSKNNVVPLVSSPSLYGSFDIKNGPIENDRYTFYVSCTNYNKIVKIVMQGIFIDQQFNKVVGTSPFFLTPFFSTYTLPIQYMSNNTNVAIVGLETGEVTIIGEGSCIITLSQYSGNELIATTNTTIIVTDYAIYKILDNCDQHYKGIALNITNPNILYAINKNSNVIHQINITNKYIEDDYGRVLYPPVGGMVFDNENNLYAGNKYNMVKFTSKNNSSIFATVPPETWEGITGVCFDSLDDNLYCTISSYIVKIDMDGHKTIYSTDIGAEFFGIAIDKYTKDIYVNTNSSIYKVVIDSDTSNTITTKLADISNARGIAYLDGVIYCCTSNDNAYQIVLGQVVNVLDWISSPLLVNAYTIIAGPGDGTADGFYVSTSEASGIVGNGILNIIDNRDINIVSEISVNQTFYKTIGNQNFNMNATSNNPSNITYSSSNTNVAVVGLNTGEVTITGLGSCKITMTQNVYHNAYVNDKIYYLECSAESTINVAAPIISVVPSINKMLNDSPFTITATSNSTLPISYDSTDSSVVSVESTTGEVTINGVGSATINSKQMFNNVQVSSATTLIKVYRNQPFGNVTAMCYDNIRGLCVCSNNEYPYNFIKIDDNGDTTSLNIRTTNADITCINTDSNIYVGGTFSTLSGNQRNANVSELTNEDILYSVIELSVNGTFVDNIENNQTIGITTTDNGIPFEISKKI